MEIANIREMAPDHHDVYTEIHIDAPKATVWQVLTDFTAMADWSPSFKGVIGVFEDGAKVNTIFDMGEGDEEYSATLILVPGTSFGWSEDYNGITDNHHYRVGALSPATSRFIQTDAFQGTADWSTTSALATLYLDQYSAFNRALKAEAERLAAC